MAKPSKGTSDSAPDSTAGDAAKPFLSRRAGILAVVVVFAALAYVIHQVQTDPGERPQAVAPAAIGGPFTLVDQDGKTVTEAAFRGRFALVFFGYTFCPDVCPTALTEVSNALDMLGDAGAKVMPVFITVDPARDRPEHLKEYLGFFHPRMVGLTGTPEQVAAAAKAYKVYYKKGPAEGADANDYLMDHTAIVYLMGTNGRFVTHFPQGTGAAAMAAKIREYL